MNRENSRNMESLQNSRTNNLNFGEYVIGKDQVKHTRVWEKKARGFQNKKYQK